MNYFKQITAVVPRLSPATDGVGDYGLNLARKMRQKTSVNTQFIIGDPDWIGDASIVNFTLQKVSNRSDNALLELLPKNQDSEQVVFLHYVGYGYARRGCPVWLVTALEKWRKAANNRRLVTMFHEVYAFGPIWNSQFWTSPLQRNLAARLVKLSDRCITSKQEYADLIIKLGKGKHLDVPTLPVFSNVGEPESLKPLSARPRRLVIFGGSGPRSRVYQQSQIALARTCQELQIEEILDIGPGLKFDLPPVNHIPVTCLGIKSASEISEILSNSLVGFFNYPLPFLTKSTIFAAYCAHGVLPVGTWYEAEDIDGLVAGTHYWLGDNHEQKMNLDDGQIVADNAYNWYEKHNLSAQAKIFTNCISFK
ncbi:MAG: glycosyltransferase family 1 protein [Sphaerospermopsis sp. SIO1G1]|nr:glycosyltransferase family 1 protein [Sphaerospermopsis sp. SIO1G1]